MQISEFFLFLQPRRTFYFTNSVKMSSFQINYKFEAAFPLAQVKAKTAALVERLQIFTNHIRYEVFIDIMYFPKISHARLIY